MGLSDIDDLLKDAAPRRVVVVSDRYPPDVAGGAELSLHMLLREPALRDDVFVVTFDKAVARPTRRAFEGVDVLALPAPAAWPLHRLSQAHVDDLKSEPFFRRWSAYLGEAFGRVAGDPARHGPALAARAFGDPPGGLRMDHATTPESAAPEQLAAVVRALGPALVHADNARAIMTAAAALEGDETPFVAQVRDHRFTSPHFDQRAGAGENRSLGGRLAARAAADALAFRQACLARAAGVVVTSDHLAATLHGVVPPERLFCAPLEPAAVGAAGPRRDDGGFRALIVGSLHPNKGQAALLEALPELVRRIPNLSIDIAGAGPDARKIEALAARHGAAARVRLHGFVRDAALDALYAQADVVALPTLWPEPFGRVPLEAGAAGRPVVAYAVGGLVETVIDGVNGRLVPAGDRDAFVAALAALAEDPAARERMGAAGRALVAERHAPAALAADLAALWDGVVPSPGPQVALAAAR